MSRKTQANKVANLASALADKVQQISQLKRWHATRVVDIETLASELYKSMNDLFDVSLVEQPLLALPVPAVQQKLMATPPPQPVVRKVVRVPVGQFIRSTKYGALIYATPGLVGGEFIGTKSNKVVRRPNNERSVPNKMVRQGYDFTTKTIGVDEQWLNDPSQQDLRDYIAKV